MAERAETMDASSRSREGAWIEMQAQADSLLKMHSRSREGAWIEM